MPTYTYFCEECQHITDVFYKLSEVRPDIQSCEVCGAVSHYQLAAPMVLKASYLDGQRSKAWKDVKEASRLNRDAAVESNPETKAGMEKEIKKIGYTFNKDGI